MDHYVIASTLNLKFFSLFLFFHGKQTSECIIPQVWAAHCWFNNRSDLTIYWWWSGSQGFVRLIEGRWWWRWFWYILSHLPSILMKTNWETCDYLNEFFTDDQEGLVAHSLPHSLVSATDSGGNDQEDIQEYLKSLKRRAEKSSSNMQDKYLELWMLPILVGFSSILYLWLWNCKCFIGRNGDNPCTKLIRDLTENPWLCWDK